MLAPWGWHDLPRVRQVIKLELPMPVSVNGMYLTVRGGKKAHGTRRILTPKARLFKETVRWHWLEQIRPHKGADLPYTCPVQIFFNFFPPDKRKYDTGNFTKALYDALCGLAWVDDSQITHETLEKMDVFKGGKCELFIGPYIKTWVSK